MPYLGNQHIVGDSVNNFKVLDDISSFTATFDGSASSVVSTANETIRVPKHRFVQGQRVTYNNGGGSNIGGLSSGTAYYVIYDTEHTIKLAASASDASSLTAINLNAVGGGTSHTLNVAFDGVNTKFRITHGNGNRPRFHHATQLNIAINNVIQRPNNSLNFTEGYAVEVRDIIVFKTAPTVNDIFFGSLTGETRGTFDITDHRIDRFTGDGTTTLYTLTQNVPNNESLLVTLNGVVQHPTTGGVSGSYSIVSGTTNKLQFTASPALGVDIQIRHLGFAGASSGEVSGFYGRTGNVGLTSTDHITTGDITSRNINSSGIITATSFVGSGANLTGIDATSVKDSGGNIKIQAQASGAIHTGVSTFTGDATFSGNVSIGGTLTYEDVKNVDSVGVATFRDGIKVGSGVTIEPNGQATFTGIVTFGSSSTTIDGDANTIKVGTALTLGHTQGLQFHTQNLHSAGFEVNQINATGVITATSFSGSGANLTGIDATALKDSAGNVKVQANSTGAVVTGILTATTIVGDGTGGIKLPVGNTGARVNTTGMLRFNNQLALPEYYNGTEYVVIDSPPTISSVSPTEVASDAGGNETFTINGSRFASGAIVKFVSNNGTEITASTVTVVSSTQLTAVIAKSSFVNAQEPYDVKVIKSSGLSATLADQINVDNAPAWTTSAGSLGTIEEDATGNHFTVAATDAEGDTVSYSLQSGSLGGLSLNSSTGVISGDPTDVSADTTNSFTLRATAGGKTADRAFSYVTKNIPTFYDQIVTTMGLDTGDNLAILIDPFDPSSDSGSGTITNRSGRSGVNVNITLNGLGRGGTGKGKYWEVLTGIDSYMNFGNGITNCTNATTRSWAYCGWWRPDFEVDENNGILWMLNDGDWSPFSQIGIRAGQGNGYYLHSGSSHSFVNTSMPSATYTNKWIFFGVFHYVGGGTVVVQGFHDATNLTSVVFSSANSSTGNPSGHNMLIGARPDATNYDTPTGTRIGPQAAWYGGDNSFVSGSSISTAQSQFETIFDATKSRYS